MKKEEIQIEFPEAQTLAVRGKSERSYSVGLPSAGRIEDVSENSPVMQGNEDPERSPSGTKRPGASNTSNDQNPDHTKFWLSERSVGEFYRTFHFPATVDQDAVSAKLSDGILTVSVPKAKKPEPRRVAIN
ncbi:Hsp20/alpha crystallin family protein, partial [Klebsiella pneumoniae]